MLSVLNASEGNGAETPSVFILSFSAVIFEEKTAFSEYTTFNRE